MQCDLMQRNLMQSKHSLRCVLSALKAFLVVIVVAALSVAGHAEQPLLRTPEMKDIWTPENVEYGFRTLDFSPDGKTLAVSVPGTGSRVQLWEIGTSRNRRSLQAPTRLDFSTHNEEDTVVFSPDGTMICGYSTSGAVRTSGAKNTLKLLVWDAKTGKLLCSSQLQDEALAKGRLQVRHLTWTPDGPTIFMVGREHTDAAQGEPFRVFIWDATKAQVGQCVLRRKVTLEDSIGRDLSPAISPDGKLIAGGAEGKVMLWDGATGHLLRTLANPDEERFRPARAGHYGYPRDHLLFSPDGQLLLSYGSQYNRITARLWDVQNGETWLLREAEHLYAAAFSPDSQFVAGGSLSLWEARSGKRLGGVNTPIHSQSGEEMVAFWPDAGTVATSDRALVLWDRERLRRLEGRIVEPPTTGAPQVQEYSGEWGNVQDLGNNYGYAIDRVPVQVNKPGENPRSVLKWQVQEAATKKVVGTLPENIYYGQAERAVVAIAPGGKIVAVVDWESETANARVLLWDVERGQAMQPLRVPKENVEAMRFSPDGKLLATSSSNERVRLWDVRAAKLLHRFTVGKGGYLPDSGSTGSGQSNALAFSPDGKHLALPGTAPGTPVVLWDVSSGHQTRALRSTDLQGVLWLAFSPDGKFLAAGGAPLRLWDLRADHPRRAFALYGWSGYATDARVSQAAFTENDGALWLLSYVEYEGTYKWNVNWLRDPPRSLEVRTLTNPVASPNYKSGETTNWSTVGLVFSPDGQILAAAGKERVSLWDVATGRLRRTVPAIQPYAFSPDGALLHTNDRNDKDHAWNAATGQKVRTAPTALNGPLTTLRGTRALGGSALPDPIQFRITSVQLASARGARPKRVWLKYPEWLDASAFSPDGKVLAGAMGRAVALWDVGTGAQRFMAPIGDDSFIELAFSDDGRLLAGVSILGFIHLWDARSGTWLRTLAGHTSAILDIDFSPDGKTLATAGDDYTVRLWDVATGQSTQLWEGHTNAVTAVAFSPNGKTLASSSYDGTVKLWQVE